MRRNWFIAALLVGDRLDRDRGDRDAALVALRYATCSGLRTGVLGSCTCEGAEPRGYHLGVIFLLAFIIPMVLGFWAQHRVKSTFARNLEVPVANGMTGAQVARRILDANGLNEVPVEETPGSLSDHYDPRSRSVHLSEPVFRGVSVASTAVGAHEVGHAIQHAQAYAFFRFRSAMFPAVQFASNIWMLFLLGGIFLSILGFIYVAIALYCGRRSLPVRHAAGRVRRLAPGEAAARRPRARRLERGHRGARRR